MEKSMVHNGKTEREIVLDVILHLVMLHKFSFLLRYGCRSFQWIMNSPLNTYLLERHSDDLIGTLILDHYPSLVISLSSARKDWLEILANGDILSFWIQNYVRNTDSDPTALENIILGVFQQSYLLSYANPYMKNLLPCYPHNPKNFPRFSHLYYLENSIKRCLQVSEFFKDSFPDAVVNIILHYSLDAKDERPQAPELKMNLRSRRKPLVAEVVDEPRKRQKRFSNAASLALQRKRREREGSATLVFSVRRPAVEEE